MGETNVTRPHRRPTITVTPTIRGGRDTGRRLLALLTLTALPLLLTACPGERTAPQRGGSVTVVELADIDKPMPLISESSLDNQFQGFMFRPLLQPWWEDGEIHYLTHEENPMALAHSWEYVGADSSAIRFHLVADALWSDGEPVTAHDAAWHTEMRGDPRTASPRQDYNENIVSVEAEDDHTLLIQFTHRYPEMLFHTSGPISPRHPFEGADPAGLRAHPVMTDPAGNLPVSGPFMISRWQRGQQIVLVPNPNFSPQPRLERIVFRIIVEETGRMVELQTGRADMVSPIPFDRIEGLQREVADLRMERREGRFYDYIAYNPARYEVFDDPDIRRALGLAVDHEGLISALNMDEYARPAGGPYSPIFQDLYDPEEQAPLPYDPEEALRLLEEAGFRPGPGGVLLRNNRPLRFTLTTNAGNQRRLDAAQIIQQQWRRIGVDMRIQTLESNTFFDRLTRRDLQAALGGWGVGLSPDLTGLWAPGVPFNYTGFEDPRVTELFEQALAQPTRDAAAPYWREAASLIVAAQPYTWLYYMDEVVGVRDRLRGTTINTLSTYQNLWEWWVTDAD